MVGLEAQACEVASRNYEFSISLGVGLSRAMACGRIAGESCYVWRTLVSSAEVIRIVILVLTTESTRNQSILVMKTR